MSGFRGLLQHQLSLSPQPCHFDYAVFCPNFTEVSVANNAGGCWRAGVIRNPSLAT